MALTSEPDLNEVLVSLSKLHPKKIDLSLGRLQNLLKTLGNPEKKVPPTIHVAGTNGKGSTIAFMRAILEAAGLKVHIYTSPHLVSFRERIRLAGDLIEEQDLIEIFMEVEAKNAGNSITFFEITTAAAFLAFSRISADILILEVGLGGKFDATNVIESPLLSVVTPIGVDHSEFLGTEISAIAAEKAGIAKKGAPLVSGPQNQEVFEVLKQRGEEVGVPFFQAGATWTLENQEFKGFGWEVTIPDLPLLGRHQIENAGTVLAALFSQNQFEISNQVCIEGLKNTQWPARFQSLDPASFKAALPKGTQIWLDGGHNPLAGIVLANKLSTLESPITVIVGMMSNKDIKGFLEPMAEYLEQVFAVPVPSEENGADPGAIIEVASALGLKCQISRSVEVALEGLSKEPSRQILITGSLYLAGAVLRDTGFIPQ